MNIAKNKIIKPRYYMMNFRINRNLSQKNVCDKIGMSYSLYSNIENGKRGDLMCAKLLKLFAEAFEVSIEEMVLSEAEYMNKIEKLNKIERITWGRY